MNILKTRKNGDEFEEKIDLLYQKYNLELPPILKLFLETFEISHEFVKSEYYLDDYGDLFQIGGIGYLHPQFEEFASFENIYRNYGDFLEIKIINENKYWIIGGGEGNGQLVCVSTLPPEEDKIVRVEPLNNVKEEWEDNVFEFLNNFVFGDFEGFIEFDRLIQFWGDDYWKQKDKLHIEYNNSGRSYIPIPRLGFTFIGIRPKEDVNNIKDLLGDITLPFRVNTFLTYFKFEGKKGLKTFDIYDEKLDQYIRFEMINYSPFQLNGENIIIDELYIDEQLATSIKLFKTNNQKFLEIGKTQTGDRIHLGIEGINTEEVWLVSETPLNDNGDLMIKLADDIFKFIRGLEPIYQEEYFDKIYRNWGEDFWRIQENEA